MTKINESSIVLSDNRKLAYAEYGSPTGNPVLYFHGAPSSRLEALCFDTNILAQFGIRFIAPDRPGMGNSEFQQARGFSHWPTDVVELADSLNLERFSIVGNSGGAPYVAVCAGKIPQRINSAVIVSGGWRMDWSESRNHLPFINRLVMILARHAPWLLRAMLSGMGTIGQGKREQELTQIRKRMPIADYEALAKPGQLEAFGNSIRESMRHGTKGPAYEMGMYVREFDFDVTELTIPITWFHGEEDRNAPLPLVRRVVSEQPLFKLKTFSGEAHLSTLINHQVEIAQAIAGVS